MVIRGEFDDLKHELKSFIHLKHLKEFRGEIYPIFLEA